MGGGGGGNPSSVMLSKWEQDQLTQQMDAARNEAAKATQQQLAGTQLDWLRTYGQSSAMAAMTAANIPAPFSTKAGGFDTALLGTAGNLLPLKGTGGAPIQPVR